LIYRREPIVGQGKVHKDIVHLCKLNELVQFLDTIRTGVDLTGTVLDKLQETARLRNFGDVVKCPSPNNSDTGLGHVRKSGLNVGIGVQVG